MEDFIHDFYLLNMYKKAFAYAINPINGHNQWVKHDFPAFLPLDFDVSLKNLAFKRRPEEGDRGNQTIGSFEKLSRKDY